MVTLLSEQNKRVEKPIRQTPAKETANMRLLKAHSKRFCQFRTLLSRLNSTPRSECGNSGGSGLPATLQPIRVKKTRFTHLSSYLSEG